MGVQCRVMGYVSLIRWVKLHPPPPQLESIQWFIEDHAFSLPYNLASPLPPKPPLQISHRCLYFSVFLCRRLSLLTGEGGGVYKTSILSALKLFDPLPLISYCDCTNIYWINKPTRTICNRWSSVYLILRQWFRMFLGLPDPGQVVRGTDPAPAPNQDPSINKQK